MIEWVVTTSAAKERRVQGVVLCGERDSHSDSIAHSTCVTSFFFEVSTMGDSNTHSLYLADGATSHLSPLTLI